MSRDISKEQVVPILQTAFSPLECSVEVFDSGDKVRFRVFDVGGDPLLNVDEVLMRRLQDTGGMQSNIGQSRDRLIQRGYKLDPWRLSDAENS